jgi:hypothetical protein
MALTGNRTPELLSVTATNTASSIASLAAAKRPSLNTRCSFLQIQFDISATGNLYVGNSDVLSTNCGANLVPGQVGQHYAFDSNLIDLNNVYLLTSTASGQVNLLIMTR